MKNLSRRQIIIGAVGFLALCCVGLFVIGLFLPDADTGEATAVAEVAEEVAGEEAAEEIEETAVPTDTPEPSSTPAPTETPEPTDTPEPTNTPTVTNTPRPTNTPTNTPTPTATPTPIVIEGSGDDLVDIEKGNEPALVYVSGNGGSRHFAVQNYDANGNNINLLVNTTDPFEGVMPLDFLTNEHTAGFEVTATGAWTIEVRPLSSIEQVDVPGEISGNGNYVFALVGAPSRATITGNAGERHFAVFGYGNSRELLVNTTDPYEGTVRLASDTIIIEVKAEGEWTIVFE